MANFSFSSLFSRSSEAPGENPNPSPRSSKGEEMSTLLEEIRRSSRDAASALEGAGFRTDSEIRSLDRQDLRELLPGVDNLKSRKEIFEIIQKRKTIRELLKDLKEFMPHESLRAALTNNGVLVDYLSMMKDIKTQVDNVQNFLNAHVELLENIQCGVNQAHPEPNKGSVQRPDPATACGPLMPYKTQTGWQPQESQDVTPVGTVKYQMIVSGKTFGAHVQLMNYVKTDTHGVQFNESCEDSQIIIIFCPITSRIGADVGAALVEVKDKKPVILVLMHHQYEAKSTSSMKTWDSKDTDVVLHVNVFYHETKHGLLKCHQNDEAVSEIRKELLKQFNNIK